MSDLKLTYNGKVSQEGKLHIVNRQLFDSDLMAFAGKDVEITVEKKRSRRTLSANAYYWGVCVSVCQAGFKNLGHVLTKEETHNFLAARFLKQEITGNEGTVLGEKVLSTSALTKSEFADYIAQIQQFAAEYLNEVIPDPNSQMQAI